jgi:hypothetical protein
LRLTNSTTPRVGAAVTPFWHRPSAVAPWVVCSRRSLVKLRAAADSIPRPRRNVGMLTGQTDLADVNQPTFVRRGTSDDMKTNSHRGDARMGAFPPGAARIVNQGSRADTRGGVRPAHRSFVGNGSDRRMSQHRERTSRRGILGRGGNCSERTGRSPSEQRVARAPFSDARTGPPAERIRGGPDLEPGDPKHHARNEEPRRGDENALG